MQGGGIVLALLHFGVLHANPAEDLAVSESSPQRSRKLCRRPSVWCQSTGTVEPPCSVRLVFRVVHLPSTVPGQSTLPAKVLVQQQTIRRCRLKHCKRCYPSHHTACHQQHVNAFQDARPAEGCQTGGSIANGSTASAKKGLESAERKTRGDQQPPLRKATLTGSPWPV